MSSKIKVIHVITTIESGGAENQLALLVQKQASLGLDVSVAYLKGLNTLQAKFESSGARVINISGRFGIFSKILNLRKLTSNSSGIIHAHLPEAEIISALAKRKNSTFVISRHFGGVFYPKHPGLLSRLLSRICISRSSAVIAISNAVKEYLTESKELPKNCNISVVYYGFEPNNFTQANLKVKNEFDVLREPHTLIIGSVARLSPEKDLSTFLKGFSLAFKNNSNIKALIAGSGPELDSLVLLSKQLEISHKVVFLGKTQNIANLMKIFDVFVLTSRFEGFGMVLLEAMSIGLPIIASNVSAIPEVIGNGGPGLLFKAGDEVALASNIQELIDSAKKREVLSRDGRVWVQKFSAEKMAFQILSIYTEILT